MISVSVKVPAFTLLEFDKKKFRAIFGAAGREVANLARRNIRSSGASGRTYYAKGLGKYRASAAGQAPANRTGTLAKGMVVESFRNGLGVEIRDSTFYASFLEYGVDDTNPRSPIGNPKRKRKGKRQSVTARVMAPRPFLAPALKERESSILGRVREAMLTDIKYVPQKVPRKR